MSDEKPIWERVSETGSLETEIEESNEPEVDPIEQKAMSQGWVPLEEWQGNPDEWRPAKEFIDRSSFFEKIHNQKKEIEQQRRDIEAMKEHLRRLRQSQSQELNERIEREKLQALEEGDYHKVIELDKKARQIEEEPEVPAPRSNSAEIDELHQEWIDDNPWYESDPELRTLADGFGISYRQNNPQASAKEVYDFVTSAVKRTNPSKFNNTGTPQSQRPTNASQPQRQSKQSEYSYRDLNEDQLRIGRRYVKLGLFNNIQEYVDDLVKIGDL